MILNKSKKFEHFFQTVLLIFLSFDFDNHNNVKKLSINFTWVKLKLGTNKLL